MKSILEGMWRYVLGTQAHTVFTVPSTLETELSLRMKIYKIAVLTLQGRPLTFHVSEYTITKGGFVEFVDEKTGRNKKFHGSRCEIEEVNR